MNPKNTITASQIIENIRKLVAENPDNKYLKKGWCCYNSGQCSNGSIGCLVGQAIGRTVGNYKFDYGFIQSSPIQELLFAKRIHSTPNQERWLSTLQSYQDNSYSWKESVDKADEQWGVIDAIS